MPKIISTISRCVRLYQMQMMNIKVLINKFEVDLGKMKENLNKEQENITLATRKTTINL